MPVPKIYYDPTPEGPCGEIPKNVLALSGHGSEADARVIEPSEVIEIGVE